MRATDAYPRGPSPFLPSRSRTSRCLPLSMPQGGVIKLDAADLRTTRTGAEIRCRRYRVIRSAAGRVRQQPNDWAPDTACPPARNGHSMPCHNRRAEKSWTLVHRPATDAWRCRLTMSTATISVRIYDIFCRLVVKQLHTSHADSVCLWRLVGDSK